MKKKILAKKTRRPDRQPKKAPKKRKPIVKAAPKLAGKKRFKPAMRAPQEVIGLHNLILPRGAHKHKKLLGRGPGSGHGKTSTRGSKGQTSRAGRDFYLGFEGGQTPLIRRVPKRGFTSNFRKEYQIVNLHSLSKIKEAAITLDILELKGVIKDKNRLVKILGEGEVTGAITVQAHAFSKKASEKIEAAGGKAEIINA